MGSSDNIRGMSDRTIRPPGYHLHPQWDLVHLRHLIEYRRKRKPKFALSLAPMVDMFSILVIYLLMNFSSSGEIYFISKDIMLPRASKGTPMQSFPLVSLVGDKVIFDAEKVDGKSGVSVTEVNDEKVPELRNMLRRIKRIDQQITPGKVFKGQVNLQAGTETDVNEVKKVMRVLIEEGWTGINFVVDPRAQ